MKTEELQFIMSRIDSSISDTNNKAMILIGINTFLIGAIITNYTKITNFLSKYTFILNVSFLVIILSLIIAILSIVPLFKSKKKITNIISLIIELFVMISSFIMSIFPFYKPKEELKTHDSIIFYGSIAGKSELELLELYRSKDYDYLKDLSEQISELAKIAELKYKMLKNAILCLVFFAFPQWIVVLFDFMIGGKI